MHLAITFIQSSSFMFLQNQSWCFFIAMILQLSYCKSSNML